MKTIAKGEEARQQDIPQSQVCEKLLDRLGKIISPLEFYAANARKPEDRERLQGAVEGIKLTAIAFRRAYGFANGNERKELLEMFESWEYLVSKLPQATVCAKDVETPQWLASPKLEKLESLQEKIVGLKAACLGGNEPEKLEPGNAALLKAVEWLEREFGKLKEDYTPTIGELERAQNYWVDEYQKGTNGVKGRTEKEFNSNVSEFIKKAGICIEQMQSCMPNDFGSPGKITLDEKKGIVRLENLPGEERPGKKEEFRLPTYKPMSHSEYRLTINSVVFSQKMKGVGCNYLLGFEQENYNLIGRLGFKYGLGAVSDGARVGAGWEIGAFLPVVGKFSLFGEAKDNVWIQKGKTTSFKEGMTVGAGLGYQTPLGDVKVSALRDGIQLEIDSKGRMFDIGVMIPRKNVEGYWRVGLHFQI